MSIQTEKIEAFFVAVVLACAMGFLFFCGAARARVTQQQMQQRAVKSNAAANVLAYTGKLSGFVYWDTTKVVRNTEATLIDVMNNTETTVPVPPGCDGTQVHVWIADQTGQFNSWQASTSTFSYSMNGSSAICAYTIDRVPIGQPLLVAAFVPSEDYSFKTGMTNYGDMAAVPAPGDKATWWYTWGGGVGGVGASVTVVNTPCRDLVSSASISSASVSRSCGGGAANVNFVIGSYSDYLKSLFAGIFGSTQQLSAAQARVVAQTARPRQTLSGGALIGQSASSTNTGVSAQRAPISAANPRLANPAPTPAPMLGRPGQPLLANGGTPGALMEQAPGTTNATIASGSRTATSAAGTTVTPAKVTPPSSGSTAGPTAIPSKGHPESAYDAVTLERGVTHDSGFTNWANSAQKSSGQANSQAVAAGARTMALAPALVSSACAKDPTLRILGTSPPNVAFTEGSQYTIWGCSFGSAPPTKALIRPIRGSAQPVASQAPQSQTTETFPAWMRGASWWGAEAFTIKSWSDNSIVVTLPVYLFLRPDNPPGPVTLYVQTPGQGTSKSGFQYKPAPAVVPSGDPRCAQDPKFRILSVSPNVLTNGLPTFSNRVYYTFSGCSFGATSGTVSISGTTQTSGGAIYFEAQFDVLFWNNNFVYGRFDQGIAKGTGDLVLIRSDGRQIDVKVAGAFF